MYTIFSDPERTYIWDGIETNIRTDGRSRTDYRPVELEMDVVTHANGSAKLRLANTNILVGVKTEIDTPSAGKPDSGIMEFFVDCSAIATPSFEGKGGEELSNEICGVLSKSYDVLSLKDLCIIAGQCCWKLYVDIMILEYGGNLYDAVALAVNAALHNTRIPSVKGTYIDGENFDLQLSDDLFDCKKMHLFNIPCLVTLCKIGEYLLVDPTIEEEVCSTGSIVVSVTDRGQITTVVKIGEGSFHQNVISEGIKIACAAGIKLNDVLKNKLHLLQQQ